MNREIKIEFDGALNEAGWVLVSKLQECGDVNGRQFNNMKPYLKMAIETYLNHSDQQMNIDNLATQTPEEKEALDLIDTTPHQYKMSKFSGNEWNGEGLPPVGSLCKVNRDSFVYRVMYSSEYVVIVQNLDNDNTTAHGMDVILDLHKGNYTFSKPETPQQREERDRLEAAKELYRVYMTSWGNQPYVAFDSLDPKTTEAFLMRVDKTNYRKDSK